MAKIKKPNIDQVVELEDEEGPEGPSETDDDATDGDAEVVQVEVAAKAARPEKLRRIVPSYDGDPIIGGVRYNFKAGQEASVPQHVFELLMGASRIQVVLE